MKYTKNELKSLIKECLIEILAEGLGEPLVEAASRPAPRSPNQSQRNPGLLAQSAPPKPRGVSAALREAVKAEAKGNPVLADILADTAATTLQTQLGAEGRGPMDSTQMAIVDVEPQELFGEEAASKWAQLAFKSPAPAQSTVPPDDIR